MDLDRLVAIACGKKALPVGEKNVEKLVWSLHDTELNTLILARAIVEGRQDIVNAFEENEMPVFGDIQTAVEDWASGKNRGQSYIEKLENNRAVSAFKGRNRKTGCFVGCGCVTVLLVVVFFFVVNAYVQMTPEEWAAVEALRVERAQKQELEERQKALNREAEKHLGEAWRCVQEGVKKQLKYPLTADFPWVPDYTYRGNTYVIKSHVISQNAFGVSSQIDFVAKVRYLDYSDSCSLEHLEMELQE